MKVGSINEVDLVHHRSRTQLVSSVLDEAADMSLAYRRRGLSESCGALRLPQHVSRASIEAAGPIIRYAAVCKYFLLYLAANVLSRANA